MAKTRKIELQNGLIETQDTIKELDEAAKILNDGGTVVFPTETVYGLGADALNPEAIEKIYKAKGRPSDNPLIIHIAKKEQMIPLVKEISEIASILMERFWPGPLTLVLHKSDVVPKITTGGLDTVAIRMPNHPIALKLIELAQIAVAAPSANISGKPSPTKSQHVIDDLDGRVDAIIVGAECEVGLESTVLDLTTDIPMILRPGGITKEMLESVLEQVLIDPAIKKTFDESQQPKSPGMKYAHYAPKAEVYIVKGEEKEVVNKIIQLKQEHEGKGKKVGIICKQESEEKYINVLKATDKIKTMGSETKPEIIAKNLFDILRDFDYTDVDIILSEAVSEKEIGHAIMNRLLKAAAYRVIESGKLDSRKLDSWTGKNNG